MTISHITNAESTDLLEIINQGNGAGQIGVAGTVISFGGVVIGNATGGTGTTPLTVEFNSSTTASAIQTLLRNITFRSSSATPSTLARTVRVSLTNSDGGNSNLPTKQINVSVQLRKGEKTSSDDPRLKTPNLGQFSQSVDREISHFPISRFRWA